MDGDEELDDDWLNDDEEIVEEPEDEIVEEPEDEDFDEDLDDESVEEEPEDEIVEEEPEEPEETPPPKENNAIRQMRETLLAQKRELQALKDKEERLRQEQIQRELAAAPVEEPTLEGCGWDPDKYKQELIKFASVKVKRDELAQKELEKRKKADDLWQGAQTRYAEGKKTHSAKDYSGAEAVVETELTREQLGWLLVSTKKPNDVVYAVGKNPKMLAKLKKAETPFEFAAMIGKIELARRPTVADKSKSSKATPAEKRPKSSAAPGAVKGKGAAYEKAVAEAQRTGNLDALRKLKK